MKPGFKCIDCAAAGRDTTISREQAISSGDIFGRGLCEDCAFIATPLPEKDM